MEIKFRAERKDNNELVYGFYRKLTHYDRFDVNNKIIDVYHYIGALDNLTYFDRIFEQVLVKPETVCQLKGYDKNGKEIYKNCNIK